MDPIDLALNVLSKQDPVNISKTAKEFGVVKSTLWRRYKRIHRSATKKHQNQGLLSLRVIHITILITLKAHYIQELGVELALTRPNCEANFSD